MHETTNIPLISSELTGIWNSYMNDSMAIYVLKHFINHVDDDEAGDVIQYSLDLSNRHIQTLTGIFNQEKLPIPDGFSDRDVDVKAPRLLTDGYYLLFISYMSRIGLQNYSLILNHTARSDIRDYFSKCVNECVDLYNRLADLRLAEGIFIRAPRVEVPKTVQYIKDSSFMTDLFGEKRRLLTTEVTYIFTNILSITMARALAVGFGQVCKAKDIISYMFRGNDILTKRAEIFSTLLTDENIPIPSTFDSYVTDSTTTPYSEKLMLFLWLTVASTATLNYSAAMVNSLRGDLQADYIRLITENMHYNKDGMDIMIANGWMEQPPQVINHENLQKI